ncbi:uncharacterized protein CEXT_325021 [Caerostris extrusa]|uniref:Uncharacterized protein n=1 Tax=Caerostris extrusa TaxID=172846 RepID=A0AAV4PY42_CAEEX|nr:uncharacterized protein CEXT_325021 [Caerostris extrusa]
MRIAASKLPLLLKHSVSQSKCISSVYLNPEDNRIEVNILSNFKFILKDPSIIRASSQVHSSKHKLLLPLKRSVSQSKCISSVHLNPKDNRIEGFEDDDFEGLNLLETLDLRRNRITTLGSSLQNLVNLKLLRLESNRLRTLGKEQIPAYLRDLYLADNPFRCDCQMLLFLNYLNSTDNLVLDVPCAPPNDTSPIRPHRNVHLGVCFCAHDAQRHFMSVDCSSLGLTRLPALFSSATEEEHRISEPCWLKS